MEPITTPLLFLISVIFVSLSGVMMPGPVLAVTITKGYKDKKAGALIAFGHGVLEFPLLFLIYFGFSQFFVSNFAKTIIGLVGGIMLVFMGIQMFRTRKSTRTENKQLSYNSLTSGIITTGTNPYFFMWWTTIGAALILTASTFGFIGVLLLGIVHWFCDFFWYLFVSLATFKSRHLWNKKTQEIVFGLCSAVLIIFGLWFISSVL